MFLTFSLKDGIFPTILLVPQNIVMDLNNVMLPFSHENCDPIWEHAPKIGRKYSCSHDGMITRMYYDLLKLRLSPTFKSSC